MPILGHSPLQPLKHTTALLLLSTANLNDALLLQILLNPSVKTNKWGGEWVQPDLNPSHFSPFHFYSCRS